MTHKKQREGFATIWNLVVGPIMEGGRAVETAAACIKIGKTSSEARDWKSLYKKSYLPTPLWSSVCTENRTAQWLKSIG